MSTKVKLLLWLTFFAIFDLVIPFPITAILLIYVVLEKPMWFIDFVNDIYERNGKKSEENEK